MSKFIAIGAVAAVVAVIGGTYVLTQLRAPSLSDCGATAVAGDVIGGSFELIDKNGQLVTSESLITKPTLIYFGFTFCPDVCPLDMARNATAMDILGEEGVDVSGIFISIDPARDTPEIVGEYADTFHPDMIGLTGSAAQVDAASKAYRTVYAKQGDDPEYYLMQHSTFTYLVLPEVGFVEFFRQDDSPEEVARRTACYAAAS